MLYYNIIMNVKLKYHLALKILSYYYWKIQEIVKLIYILGTIVTVGDPKKKYTKFEKIGQG